MASIEVGMYKNSDARQRVLDRLLERGPSTVTDLASELGVVPVTMRSHLQILSRLSYALHDAAFKDVVLRQGQRDEVLREARRVEATFAASAIGAGKAAH